MRAIEYDRFGPASVLASREVPEPMQPGSGRMRARVVAASVNPKDTFVRKGRFAAMTGTAFPRRIGYDWSGVVDAVGPDTDGFCVGDVVYGMVNGWAGGTCAELLDVSVDEAAASPSGLDAIQAAAMPLAALTALQALTEVAGGVAGRHVMVHGASGGGHFAVQLAKALGARVTAVASGANAGFCRDFGADDFVDYRSEPLGTDSGRYDVVFDVFGSMTLESCAPLLADDGIVVTTVPSEMNLRDVARTVDEARQRMRLVVVRSNRRDLELLATMAARGQLVPFVERCYAYDDVGAAHEHVERKHTRGKVVVRISRNST